MTSTRTLLAEHAFLDGPAPSSFDRIIATRTRFRIRGGRIFAVGAAGGALLAARQS